MIVHDIDHVYSLNQDKYQFYNYVKNKTSIILKGDIQRLGLASKPQIPKATK